MVLIEDFEFQLVSADGGDTGTNTPFMEHTKGSKTYVEVEPDAEYFLSIRKVQVSSSALVCNFKVDGEHLRYHTTLKPKKIHGTPKLIGLRSRSNGIQTHTALQFVKASFATSTCVSNAGIKSSLAGMGNIEMDVFSQGIPTGETKKKQKDYTSSMKTLSIDIDASSAAGVTMKKNLRSGKGKTTIVSKSGGTGVSESGGAGNKFRTTYAKGTHLYTITLYYCATPGLIAVGVLPKPPLWTYARMLYPATTTDGEKKQAGMTVDLSDDDEKIKEDDVDKKNVKKENNDQQDKKKKVKTELAI